MTSLRDLNGQFLFAAVVKNEGFSAAARALRPPKSQISGTTLTEEEPCHSMRASSRMGP